MNFEKGTYGDPADLNTQLMYWMNQEKAHYPFARDNVERIKALIEQQRQQEQMMAEMQHLEEQNAALQADNANRAAYGEQLLAKAQGLERDNKMHEDYESFVAGEIDRYNRGR